MVKQVFQLMVICALVFQSTMYAQEKEYNGDPDVTFETARKLAFDGKRLQAQDSLKMLLKNYPNYNDIRDFLASTYSWDGKYDLAKKEFSKVLKNDPERETTWVAAINNELWSEAPFTALEMANEGLKHFPESEVILLVKAKAEANGQNPEDAAKTIKYLLKVNPTNKDALNYQERLNQTLRMNAIGINSSIDFYSEIFDPMQYYSLKYKRRTTLGSVILKGNFSKRFGDIGGQFEVDMYPKIAKGLYAYLNIGVSNSYLYPNFRYGAELHQSLPHSFEISLGMRSLKYSSTTNIFTGSVGWYTGNSYWSFRPYFTPGDSGTSTSGTLNYRLYRNDADNYFTTSVGIGFSPEFYNFEVEEGKENSIIELKSQKFNLGYYFTSKTAQHAWGTQLGITHQERVSSPGDYIWTYSLGLLWELKFK